MKLRFLFLFFEINILHAWTPIGSIYNYENFGTPKSIIIENKEYVVWKNNQNQFVVQDNKCLHRLAPLSEGRIENNTYLQCGYHGWEYDSNGRIAKIPQQENRSKNLPCTLKTFSTRRSGDILWANLENAAPNIMDHIWNSIANDDILMHSNVPFVREVPYSWNFLMENFFDPAHIPFAHHGLQSFRSDATFIPIQLLQMNEQSLHFLFEDMTRGRKRQAKMEFTAPFLYRLVERENNEWKRGLTLLCVPIKEGKSRVFLCEKKSFLPLNHPIEVEKRIKAHNYSNQFFNTDDYIVHKQEIQKGKSGKTYNMPTTSDYAVKVFQKWNARYYPQWIFQNHQELSKESAQDNYKHHIQFCFDCYTHLCAAKLSKKQKDDF